MGDKAWETPGSNPEEIVARYGALLEKVPTARAWARIEGSAVHFFTVLDFSHGQAEEALYEAERNLIDAVGPDAVVFDVYPDLADLKQEMDSLFAVPRRLAA